MGDFIYAHILKKFVENSRLSIRYISYEHFLKIPVLNFVLFYVCVQ